MQTKKRAKPVKFNNKEIEKKSIKEAAKEIEEKVSLDKEQGIASSFDKDPDSKDGDTSIEAIFSSSVETIDIKETISASNDKDLDKEANLSEDNTEVKVKDEPEKKQKELINEKVDVDPSELDLQKTSQEILSDDTPPDEISKDYPLEKDRAFFNQSPDDYDNKKSSLPYFFTIMLITFIVGLAFFAGIYYAVINKPSKNISNNKKNGEAVVSPTFAPPTSQPINLAAYTIQVLNGTSSPGLAAKVKTDLETEGFKVLSVGNAENTDFVKTEILARKKVNRKFIDKLKEVLSKTYKIGAVSNLGSGEADLVVKIGSESAK